MTREKGEGVCRLGGGELSNGLAQERGRVGRVVGGCKLWCVRVRGCAFSGRVLSDSLCLTRYRRARVSPTGF